MKRKLFSNKGVTLIELLVCILVMVLLVVGIGTSMGAATRVYTESTDASDSAILADLINSSLEDLLRYGELSDMPGDGSFKVKNTDFHVYSPGTLGLDNNGRVVITYTKDTASVVVNLVASGSYPGLKVTDFSVKYNNGVFNVSYTIVDSDDASNVLQTQSFRIRHVVNAVEAMGMHNPADDKYNVTLKTSGSGHFDSSTTTFSDLSSDVYNAISYSGATDTAYASITINGTTIQAVPDDPDTVTCKQWIIENNGNNVTITARFGPKPTTYYIYYLDSDGTGMSLEPSSYPTSEENQTVTLKTPETRTGYDFSGWTVSTQPTGGTATVSDGTTLTIPAEAYGNIKVQAGWTVKTYTVTLNANGGTITGENVTSYKYGTGATLPTKATVTKNYYTFDGWYDNSGCTGTAVTSISSTATGDKTFYAKWTPNTVYYDNFDNNSSETSKDYNADGKYLDPPDLNDSKGGYTCIGRFSTKYPGTSSVYKAEESDIKSRLKTGKTYSVAYWLKLNNGYGGTVTVPSATLNKINDKQKLQIVLPTPTRTGYTFDGWYNGSTKVGNGGDTYTIASKTTELTAHWTADTYTITIVTAGGGGSVNETSVKAAYGADVSVSDNKLTIGSTVVTASNTQETQYDYTFSTWSGYSSKVTGNCTITANFTQTLRSYTVTASPNYSSYGSVSPAVTVNYGTSIYVDTSNNKILHIGSDKTITATPNNAGVQYSYGFDSWTLSSTTVQGNVTATAKFSRTTNSYPVTVSAGANGSLTSLNTDTLSSVPYGTAITVDGNTLKIGGTAVATATANTGYKLDGWYIGETKITDSGASTTDSTTITAKFVPNDYTITFDANGGSGTMTPQTISSGTAYLNTNQFSRSYQITYNYDNCGGSNKPSNSTVTAVRPFLGWNTKADGSGTSYADGASVTDLGNTTLYAQWGSITLPSPKGYNKGSYICSGWYTAKSGGTKVGAPGGAYAPTADITLYAQWSQTSSSQEIKFCDNWGNSFAYKSLYYASGCPVTMPAYSETGLSSKDGCVCVGWNTKSDGSGTGYAVGETVSGLANQTTLYAMWQKAYQIKKDQNNATITLTTEKAVADTVVGVKVTFSKDNNRSISVRKSGNDISLTMYRDAACTQTIALESMVPDTYYYFKMPAYDITIKAYSDNKGGGGSGGGGDDDSDSCIAEGTLITMADGTQKPIELIEAGEEVLVFNHETGKLDTAPMSILVHKGNARAERSIMNLVFDDGTEIKVIAHHGFFDADETKYVYIDTDNYSDWIGHRFFSEQYVNGKYVSSEITLTDVYFTTEETLSFAPITQYHLNYFTNGVLAMTSSMDGLFNIFELDDSMKYDETQMGQDIEEYGLFTYDDFADYIPYELYRYFPAEYFKVSIGKGYLTFDHILELVDKYSIGNYF